MAFSCFDVTRNDGSRRDRSREPVFFGAGEDAGEVMTVGLSVLIETRGTLRAGGDGNGGAMLRSSRMIGSGRSICVRGSRASREARAWKTDGVVDAREVRPSVVDDMLCLRAGMSNGTNATTGAIGPVGATGTALFLRSSPFLRAGLAAGVS